MVDFVEVPAWIRRNEALRTLARCCIRHVDNGLVKVDDSNNTLSANLLRIVGHPQTSLPLSSRSEAMVS
jgi:hypothetical protein